MYSQNKIILRSLLKKLLYIVTYYMLFEKYINSSTILSRYIRLVYPYSVYEHVLNIQFVVKSETYFYYNYRWIWLHIDLCNGLNKIYLKLAI